MEVINTSPEEDLSAPIDHSQVNVGHEVLVDTKVPVDHSVPADNKVPVCHPLSPINDNRSPKDLLYEKLNEYLIHVVIQNNNNDYNGNTECIKKIIEEIFVKLYGKEIGTVEKRYQDQVDQLSLKLSAKQQESKNLKQELDKFKQANKDDKSQDTLKEQKLKIEELSRRINEKDSALEGIKLGLQQAKSEAESSKTKILRLEDELKSSKQNYQSTEEHSKTKFTARLSELEAKVKSLEEKLEKSDSTCRRLQQALDEVEEEREEELKIVQDALDEAAQEREELIATFKKELEHVNKMNTSREQQMLEDFEWKLREMQKEHKKKLEEKDKQGENTLTRPKRGVSDDEETKQKMDKLRSEINSEWEDKLRSECSRLKRELDKLHSEEKHLAVESIKVKKEQETFTAKTNFERRIDELNKSISKLKDKLSEKEAYYDKKLEDMRTESDRDIWSLRMKLQRLDESSTDKIQLMEENHKDELERAKSDFEDRVRCLESRIAAFNDQSGDVVGQLTKDHREQMQYLEEQHKLSIRRFIDETESDKFQAVEEARVILTRHHEDIENGLRDQLSEALSTCTKLRQELDNFRVMVATKEKQLLSMDEGGDSLKSNSDCDTSNIPSEYNSSSGSSQFSLASSNGSHQSQERLSLSELSGVASDSLNDEAQKSNGSLLGKVFGGGWFAGPKTREPGRRGSTPTSRRYNSST